jgi:hypothetical protein
VDDLHRSLSATPVQANRVLAALRKSLNLARRWGWIAPGIPNPAADHEPDPEARRGLAFTAGELAALGAALRAEPERFSKVALSVFLVCPLRPAEPSTELGYARVRPTAGSRSRSAGWPRIEYCGSSDANF